MTIRRYETPAAFKEALEHRIRERTAAAKPRANRGREAP